MKQKKEKKKRRGPSISTIILVVIFLAGVGIMAYPTVSDMWNSLHQSRLVGEYQETIAGLSEEEYEALLDQADQYNRHLLELPFPFLSYGDLQAEYESALNVTGNGMIGYVTIDKISVELPIYHGTSDTVLNTSAGHLEGSTLPVGGISRHAVISAHRGLPSAKLFTNLDRMEKGDIFTITVLNQSMTYEVDQILIVEPDQTEALNVTAGQDYVTLLTCTPYGINTQRMMVRGRRIEKAVGEATVRAEATKIASYIVIPAVAVPILFVFLIILLIRYRKKPRKVTLEDVQEISSTLNQNTEEKKDDANDT